MSDGEGRSAYTYWKRPWHKWLIFALGLLQFVFLWMTIREYRDISQAGIFSDAAWERYASMTYLQCVARGVLGIDFLGVFLIGALSRSRRQAKRRESLLLLAVGLAWCAGAPSVRLLSVGARWVWALFLAAALAGAAYGFVRYRRG